MSERERRVIPVVAAHRDLREWLAKGLIKRLGKGRATYYTLAV